MMDWLTVYNEVHVIPFIESIDKTRRQYCQDEIDMLKNAISIPGISMTYVLNKLFKMKSEMGTSSALHYTPQANLTFINVTSAR